MGDTKKQGRYLLYHQQLRWDTIPPGAARTAVNIGGLGGQMQQRSTLVSDEPGNEASRQNDDRVLDDDYLMQRH